MDRFQQLLDHYKDKIYGESWLKITLHYGSDDGTRILLRYKTNLNEIGYQSINKSLNDLIFGNFGFLEALKWKHTERTIRDVREDGCCSVYRGSKYHLIQLSILYSDQERIDYIVSNVVFDF